MEVTLSEPRELVPEQTSAASGGLTCSAPARPGVNSLLTQIADTLSTMQHQQPLPFPPLPPSSVTNSLPTLPTLPSLPSFPTLHNFDASALLNSLTSQGASLDSLLDSLTRVQGGPSLLCSPATSSTAGPPHNIAESSFSIPRTQDPQLSASGAVSMSPTSIDPSPVHVMSGVGLPVFPPGSLDNFVDHAASAEPPSDLSAEVLSVFPAMVEAPAVALSCTVSTGMAASALPPAILPAPVFLHVNSALVSEAPPLPKPTPATMPAGNPPATVSPPPEPQQHTAAKSTSPSPPASLPGHISANPAPMNPHTFPSLSSLPFSLPLPPTAAGGTLAINGVPVVTATVVSRSALGDNALPPPILSHSQPPPPSLPSPVALLASALPQTTSGATSTSAAPATQHKPSLSTSAPFPFIATPLAASITAPPTSHTPSLTESTLPAAQPIASSSQPVEPPATEVSLQTAAHYNQPTQPPPLNEPITQGLPIKEPSFQAPPLNELSSQGPPPSQPSPPSLHANEELLSEDSDEVEMETAAPAPGLASSTLPSSTLPLPPAPANVGSRSDSASPYTDDASFASFVAGEAHDPGSVMEEGEHFSPSPSPMPSVAQSIDALVTQLHSQSASSSRLAMRAQFGVTAYSPHNPTLPPDTAPPAPLDMTTQNFPKRSKYAHRAAMSAMHPYHRTRGGASGGGVNVAKTLDLLKAVLQSSFNMEVKRLCDDYLSLYCQAAGNIRENTGDTVPEATLRLLVNKMLEEAQHGYQKGEWEFPSGKLPRNEKVGSAKASPMALKKVKGEKGEPRYGPPKRSRKPPTEHHSEKTSWKWSMDKKRVDPGKWRPDTLSTDTAFVLGVNVNKALGHAANRGKVYYLHPELFKYACDGDDKTWLYENKYLPVHGGKAFLMILKEVEFLVTNEESYKDSEEILGAVKKLQEFQVPQFMLDKMKIFMRSVQGYFAQEASAQNSNSHEATEQLPQQKS